MAYYQNGGGSSLHLSATRLPTPLPPAATTSPPHLSPLEPQQLSPLDPPSHLSPFDAPQRSFPFDIIRVPSSSSSSCDVVSRSNHASSSTTPTTANHHHLPMHHHHPPPPDAASDTQPPTPGSPTRLSRRETDLSLNHVKLQETYINVEALGEKESDKQLTAAWKRKRRRSKETRLPDYLKSAPVTRVTHPLEESVILSFMTTVAGVVLTCVLSVPLSLLLMLLLPLAVMVKALAAACRMPWSRMCTGACQKNYLAPHDAQFLLQEGDSHAVIHSVLVIDASMSLKRIKQLLATRVVEAKTGSGGLMYPRLTQTVSYLPAGPAWVPDHNFNLHNHIFSGPSITTEEALQKYVSSLLSQPLPPARPLWEIIVLHDYGRSRDTVLVCRLHQCLSDGMSLLRVLCQSLSDNQIMHIPQKPHFGGTTYGMNLLRALLVGPLTALTWLFWWSPELNPLTIRHNAQPSSRPRRTGGGGGGGACCGCSRAVSATSCTEGGAYTVWGEGRGEGQVVVWSAGVALSSVVRIKQVTRTCLNDVLLAALAGALRLTLQRRGVNHPPDLKVNVAVDLRSTSAPFTAPRLGTKAALVPISLPLSCDAAIPRLWEVRARVDDMKASAEAVVSYGLVWLAWRLLPSSWARALLRRLHNRCSLQYSSLPGPATSLLLGGYTVKHIYNVSPPRTPTPVSVTVLTYADQVHVAVAARRSLPAAQAITTSILAEFENQCTQMAELLANRRIPGEQRRGLVFTLGELSQGQTLADKYPQDLMKYMLTPFTCRSLQLQEKLRRVQAELQQVTQQYEMNYQQVQDQQHQQDMEGLARGVGELLGDDLDSEFASCEVALLNRSRSSSSSLSTSSTTSHSRARRHSPSTLHQQQLQRQEELASRVQHLKEEFTDLLTEIRRRKSITDGRGGVGVGIQTEFEEEDGEVRKPRKRALSTTSTWSSSSSSGLSEVSSCMARPLTTPTQPALPSTPSHPASTPRPSKSLLVTDIS